LYPTTTGLTSRGGREGRITEERECLSLSFFLSLILSLFLSSITDCYFEWEGREGSGNGRDERGRERS